MSRIQGSTPSTNGRLSPALPPPSSRSTAAPARSDASTFDTAPVRASVAAAPTQTSSTPIRETVALAELSSRAVVSPPPGGTGNPFAPWIDQTYQTLLRRAPTATELQNATGWISKELGAGKNIFQAGAEIVFFIKLGPEYKKDHPLLSWMNGLYSDRLGRYPTDQEVSQAEDLMKKFAAEGKGFFQCCQGLDFCLSLSPEHQAFVAAHPFANFISDTFHKALGRAATPDERSAFEAAISQDISHGGNWMSACAAVVTFIMGGPEFHQVHPFAQWIQSEYQSTLSRAPSLDEVLSGEALLGRFMSQGNDLFKAAQMFDFCVKLSPEYQSKHPVAGPGQQVPGNVGQWIGQAQAILAAAGVPYSQMNAADIDIIIQHESGGNPSAENKWDINWQEGHPSIGLMQTIGPTFNAYALPGHGDIWNPVDNIIAGVRYAIARYGSISNVPGVVRVHEGLGYVGY